MTSELHSELLEVGREVEPESDGVANDLEDDQIETIAGTVDFFASEETAVAQTVRDLAGPAKYRVFDWLGMMLDHDWDDESLNWLFKKLAKIYIEEKDVDEFVEVLRKRDLQLDHMEERGQ